MGLQYGEVKNEVIDSKTVMMSPPAFSNHNFVKANVHNVFKNYLKGNICVPCIDGQKVVLPSQKKGDYLVPDFFVMCDRSKIKRDGVYGSPDLVVEVLSKKTTKMDRGKKMRLYQENGVKEYWIIDPDNKSIEVYLLKENVFVLDDVYYAPEDEYDDKVEAVTSFSVKLFPDLIINLDDIFEYVNIWG